MHPLEKMEAICPLTLHTAKSNECFIATCNLSIAIVFLSIHMTPIGKLQTRKFKENHAVYGGT